MKKIISIIICLCCTFCLSITASAKGVNVVSSEPVWATDEVFEIKYDMNDNAGLMGFGFIVKYNPEVFEAVSVSKGSVISTGMFNDSIGTDKKGEVKIIWSGTENAKFNGEIFTITFKVIGDKNGTYNIDINNIEDDTFDENWNDVNVSCSGTKIIIGEETKISFWQKIVDFFSKIISFIKSIFA